MCFWPRSGSERRCIPAETGRYAALIVALRSEYTRYSSLTSRPSSGARTEPWSGDVDDQCGLSWGSVREPPGASRRLPKCGGSRTETPEREWLGSGDPTPSRSWLGKSKLPRALARTSASSDLSVTSCERGGPPFTLSPETDASERSSLAVVFSRVAVRERRSSDRHSGPKARGWRIANLREARATAGPHRENWPPVSDWHRAGARNQRR